MDELGSMLAEAIARRAKAALAEQRARQARTSAPVRPAAAPAAPAPAAPAPPARPAPSAAQSPEPSAPPAVLDLDTLPGLPPARILEGARVERPMLLEAFTGKSLLSAVVFSEALAKPVALRDGGPGQ